MVVDPSATRELLEAFIAAFSVLGGGMAYTSGFRAAQALAQALAQDDLPEVVSHSINEGIGVGFETCSPLSMIALIIMVWT